MVTAALCLLGAAALLGICAYAATGDQGELNNINKDLQNLNASVKQATASLTHFDNILSKVNKSIEYLEDAQQNFKNGGCVYQNIPFANDEYNDCLEKLRTASNNLIKVKNTQQKNINEWNKNIKEREARKREVEKLIAEKDAAMREASKAQYERRGLNRGMTSTSTTKKYRHR